MTLLSKAIQSHVKWLCYLVYMSVSRENKYICAIYIGRDQAIILSYPKCLCLGCRAFATLSTSVLMTMTSWYLHTANISKVVQADVYYNYRKVRTGMFREYNGDRPGVPNIVVVITDGLANVNVRQAFQESQAAKADGIDVFAVGVNFRRKAWQLNKLASRPLNRFKITVSDFDQLSSIRRKLFTAVCDGRWRASL